MMNLAAAEQGDAADAQCNLGVLYGYLEMA
jgi:hypothetical protein